VTLPLTPAVLAAEIAFAQEHGIPVEYLDPEKI